MMRDAALMARALRLAGRGLYGTAPNPRVGCVLARDGEIVGEGWHERAGGPHAEVRALDDAGPRAAGATAYVTLEPCHHQGRTGPCSAALMRAGVARVVYAAADEGERSAGGAEALRAAGMAVEGGLLAASAETLNPGFHRRQRGGRPWLRLKLAQSFDGRTALPNGESQWITGEDARADVHRWRARSCVVLTGIGTVLADDPQLTARSPEARRQPLRAVLDSRLQTPADARVLDGAADTVLFHCAEGVARAGAERMPQNAGRVDLRAAIGALAARGCNEILVECGATLAGSLLLAGLVDELIVYTAPMLLGDGAPLLALPGIAGLDAAPRFRILDHRRIGADSRIIAAPV